MASLRDLLRRTPGFAGGNLGDQLMRDNPNPQVLTPQNQQVITRPRTVMPQGVSSLRDMMAQQPVQQPDVNPEQNPLPMRQMQPDTGIQLTNQEETRPKRTQMRDFVSDDQSYLRELEQKPRNWKDKTVDAVRALNTNFNGPGQVSPPTKREREIARAQGILGRDVGVAREKSTADAREAAILAGQDRIRQGDERLQQGGDRIKQQQRQTLASVLNRMDEFDPEAPENLEMVNALRANNMPVVHKKRGQQLKFVQNASTGEWETIAGDKTTGLSTSSHVVNPEGGTLTTDSEQKLGREQNAAQFEKRLKFQREMGALNRDAAMARAQVMANAANSRLGDADEYGAMADKLDDEAEGAESDGTRTGKETAARLRTMANQNRVLASKARKAQSGGQPADSAPAPKTGRTIEGAIRAFTKSQKRAPTPDEVAKMKAALGQ